MKIILNLLPPAQKKVLRTNYVFRTILDQQILLTLFIAVVIACFMALNTVLGVKVTTFETLNSGLQGRDDYAEVVELHALFDETNDRISVISAVQKEHIVWSDLFALLNDVVPVDVSITSFETIDDMVNLSGVSGQVESLGIFQEKLAQATINDVKCFESVSVPDRYLVNSRDVQFEMTFVLNVSGCMKQNS